MKVWPRLLIKAFLRLTTEVKPEFSKHNYYWFQQMCLPWAEAIAQSCSAKKVFLRISQNLQENTRVKVTLYTGWALQIYLKKRL